MREIVLLEPLCTPTMPFHMVVKKDERPTE